MLGCIGAVVAVAIRTGHLVRASQVAAAGRFINTIRTTVRDTLAVTAVAAGSRVPIRRGSVRRVAMTISTTKSIAPLGVAVEVARDI